MAESTWEGESTISGGKNPVFSLLGQMEYMKRWVLQLGGPGLIQGLYDIGKSAIKDVKALSEFQRYCDEARDLMEDEKTIQAIRKIQEAIKGLENDGVSKDVIRQMQQVVQNSYNDMLDQNNHATKEEFLKYFEKERNTNPDISDLLDELQNTFEFECSRANNKKEPIALKQVMCENRNLDVVVKNLQKAGIPARAMYKDPATSPTEIGYVIVPNLSEKEEMRVYGAVRGADIRRVGKNLFTRDAYDTVCEFLGIKESSQISGLTKAEAELMKERLWNNKNGISFPAAVVESPTGDGSYAVLFPTKNEARVNQIMVECLMNEKGYGEKTELQAALLENADTRDKILGAITLLSDNKDMCFTIVDTSNLKRNADPPEYPTHFMRLGKGYLDEYRLVKNEKTGKLEEKVIKSTDLTKERRGVSADMLIQDEILHICKNPLILSEKQAENAGITRDKYEPNKNLLKRINRMRNVDFTRDIVGRAAPGEDRKELITQIDAKMSFEISALKYAREACQDDPSIENIAYYIANNTDELIEKWHADDSERIEKMPDGEKKIFFRERLEAKYSALKGSHADGMSEKECAEAVLQEINSRIKAQSYEKDLFTVQAIDSVEIDQKTIFEIQRMVAENSQMENTLVTRSSIEAAVKGARRESFDDSVKKYERTITKKYPSVTKEYAEKLAVTRAISENLENAVFKGADFEDNNSYVKQYGFDFETAATNLDKELFDKHGVHVYEVIMDESAKNAAPEYAQKIENAKQDIKPLIRQEVSRQFNEQTRENEHKEEH